MAPEPLPALSVLVVDEYPDAAQSTAEVLTLSGYHARVALDPAAALREVARGAPDVILLGSRLPAATSWNVVKRIRAAAAGRQPVVVAVAASGSAAERLRSAAAGIDLHLIKPADPDALVALLGRIRAARATPPDRPADG